MKLISQMKDMYRNAYKMMKTAKENDDRDLELILSGVRSALLWVQESKNDECSLDEIKLKIDAGLLKFDNEKKMWVSKK